MRILLVFIICLSLLDNLHGQSSTITLKDAKTKEAIAFAHVMIGGRSKQDSLKHFVSNINGQVKFNTQHISMVHVSYVGYKILIDSINKNESKTFYLEPDVFNIETFVVTASCTPQKADNSIYEIKVISKKDIESKGANNLTDLLNSELNMRISNDGALGASVSLQGLSGEHLKILVDGVPVVGRKNGNIDLSQINLNNVDHIEVIEGPMSVVYGSNALAGVINIITTENKNSSITSSINNYYETVGVYNIDADFSYRKKKNYVFVAAGRNFFDGYTTTPELRSMMWKPKRQYNGNIDYSYTGLHQTIKLSASIFDELLQDKGNLLAPYYETAFDQYFHTVRSSIRGDYVNKLPDSKQITILASYSNYDWSKSTVYKDLTTLEETVTQNPDLYDTTIVNSWMSRGIYSRESEKHKLNYQMGYDFSSETATGKRILDQSQTIGDYAGFINLKYSGVRNFVFQPGLRYGYNTKYTEPLVYSFNALFSHNKTNFRASFAKGFRSPSIKELYLDFHDVNHNINGNQDLKAEYSQNIGISANTNFTKKNSTFSLKGSLFYNHIDNIITLAMLPSGAYTYTNLETYITKGFDLGFKYNFYPRLTFNSGWAYTGILNSISQEISSSQFLYSSSVTMSVEYQFTKPKITTAIYYKYNGKLPQVLIDEDGNLKETFIDSYNTLDFSMSRLFIKNRLKVTIGAKNLFNNTVIASTAAGSGTAHTSGSDLPVGWGRTAFISLSYTFTKY